MNLIAKTTFFYLLVSVFVFGAGGWVTYHLVKREVTKETDFALYDQVDEVAEDVRNGVPLELLKRGKIDIEYLGDSLGIDTFYRFSDTLGPHPYRDGEMESYRKIERVKTVDSSYYHISITDVFIESDDIYEVVVEIMWRLFLILGISMLVASFLLTRWLLAPFQRILSSIRGFDLRERATLSLPETSTKEFRQLNAFVTAMAEKARRDFQSVKEFSENASHEMQTPLSIAQGKLELLTETEPLSEEQLRLIGETQQSLRRLSKLGNALLLLTKIENQEFQPREPINFSRVVNDCLDNFEELAMLRGLPLQRDIESDVQLSIEPTLADVLISNLVRNAIRHNIKGGRIELVLDQHQLCVRNTGAPPSVPTHELFGRFQKSQQSEQSLGLGLAIVEKVCGANHFDINYCFKAGWHKITVVFPKNV